MFEFALQFTSICNTAGQPHGEARHVAYYLVDAGKKLHHGTVMWPTVWWYNARKNCVMARPGISSQLVMAMPSGEFEIGAFRAPAFSGLELMG